MTRSLPRAYSVIAMFTQGNSTLAFSIRATWSARYSNTQLKIPSNIAVEDAAGVYRIFPRSHARSANFHKCVLTPCPFLVHVVTKHRNRWLNLVAQLQNALVCTRTLWNGLLHEGCFHESLLEKG